MTKKLGLLGLLPTMYNVGINGIDGIDEKIWFEETKKPGYPHNIIEEKDGTNIIEFALAGFTKDDISVKVENNILKIDVVHKDDTEDEEINKYLHHGTEDTQIKYLHHGIARRQLHTGFTLGSRVITEKISSKFIDGMLIIEVPIDNTNKKITIM